MKIAFIGYGDMAQALSKRWVSKHDLFIASATRKRQQN